MVEKKLNQILKSYKSVGPTSDNSSRLVRLKQVQKRVGTPSGSTVTNYLGQKVTGKQKNVNGASASERLYFTRSFPRMSLVKQ
jgi:hypothetical protein|tara:strand:- start:5130 stop:5378 length:249 start_codon:yes stop_codon:yes gene_type:complete